MVIAKGLVGLRPADGMLSQVVSPPYDVIKPGSDLESTLQANPRSIYHVILGNEPKTALQRLVDDRALIEDTEPAFYVYEQSFDSAKRLGVFLAAEVTDYSERQVIRHEKTFDSKVQGRIALARDTGYTIGPVFMLSKSEANLSQPLDEVVRTESPTYEFKTDFGPETDLSGVSHRVWRVAEGSALGKAIASALGPHPMYIADGHHRYHAALRGGQSHLLVYVTPQASILAYDRVIRGTVSFEEIREKLELTPAPSFTTPRKHEFCIYSRQGCWTLKAQEVPEDVVGKLDCSILERELYPILGLTSEHIADSAHFDYYPQSAHRRMVEVVDEGTYDLAVALHPVSQQELMEVADAGLTDADIVMPQKSTFFSPKLPTGLFLYRHAMK